MDTDDIFLAIGKFEAKIQSLERSVEHLDTAIIKLAEALEQSKSGWKLLLALAACSSLVGASLNKPFDLLLQLFK